jgi:hypothetical protein
MNPVKKNKNKKQAKQSIQLSQAWGKFLHNKYVQIVLLLAITICFFSNYSAIFDRKLSLNGDNIIYFSCGQSIAHGKGYTNTIGFEESPQTHFPPGYSVFIAGILKIFPNNIIAVKTINGILLLLSIIIIYFLIRKMTGNVVIAFITAMLCCLQKDLLSFSTIMMSEMLFLFTTGLAVYLAILLNERKLFVKKELFNNILFLCYIFVLIYAYFVRTVGASLVIAVILWTGILTIQSFFIWLKSRKKGEDTNLVKANRRWFLQKAIVCLIISLTFFGAKSLWDARNARAGKTEMAYSGEFIKKKNGEKMKTVDDWTTRIKNNIENFTTKWIPAMMFDTKYDKDAKATSKEWIRGIAILVLMIFGLAGNKKGGLLLTFYLGITMCVLLLFPEQFQGSRYCIAIIPFFIFLILNGLATIVALLWKLIPRKPSPLIWQSILIILFSASLMFPVYSNSQKDLRESAQYNTWQKLKNPPMNDYLTAVKWCKDNLSDSSRVVCRKPEIFYMYSNFRHAGGFPQYASPDTIMNLLIEQKATHVIIDSWFRHAYTTIYPAVIKYPEKFKMVYKIGTLDTALKINPTLILEFHPECGYFGERVNGKKEGKGYEIFPNGRKYVGEFSNNAVNGYGELFDSTGTLLAKGVWKNGMLISQKK